MTSRERQRIGPFVVTTERNLDPDAIRCARCERTLAVATGDDGHEPCVEALAAAGAVAVPDFGWFCGQACALAYEDESGVCFRRNAHGAVGYYDE